MCLCLWNQVVRSVDKQLTVFKTATLFLHYHAITVINTVDQPINLVYFAWFLQNSDNLLLYTQRYVGSRRFASLMRLVQDVAST